MVKSSRKRKQRGGDNSYSRIDFNGDDTMTDFDKQVEDCKGYEKEEFNTKNCGIPPEQDVDGPMGSGLNWDTDSRVAKQNRTNKAKEEAERLAKEAEGGKRRTRKSKKSKKRSAKKSRKNCRKSAKRSRR